MATDSDLCLTCAIIVSILIYHGFGLWTITNDPCPIHIIFDQNDGRVVGSPSIFVSLLLKAFFKDIPNGRMGWS